VCSIGERKRTEEEKEGEIEREKNNPTTMRHKARPTRCNSCNVFKGEKNNYLKRPTVVMIGTLNLSKDKSEH
jgi:hypothetical protein